MIKNIVLDMGNVLLDYNPHVSLDAFFETEEDKAVILKEYFSGPEWVQSDLGMMTDEEIYKCVCERVPERLWSSLHDCVHGWDICMKPFEKARDFVKYVKGKGYHVFVLSNASNRFYHYFPRFLPIKSFDGIVVSADVHIIKPDLKIYQHLLDKYNLIASECLFIDDRQDNVDGAMKTGMQAVRYDENFNEIQTRFQL